MAMIKFLFFEIVCFKGIFSLEVKEGAKLYHPSSQWIAFMLQKAIQERIGMPAAPAINYNTRSR